MRLINIHTLEQTEFNDPPPYAILSHRWKVDELAFKDYDRLHQLDTAGAQKVREFCAFLRAQAKPWTLSDIKEPTRSCESVEAETHQSMDIDDSSKTSPSTTPLHPTSMWLGGHCSDYAVVDEQEEPPLSTSDSIPDVMSHVADDGANDETLVEWALIDTCYIDRISSSELSEAINSMWKWYRRGVYCVAYLSDIHQCTEQRKESSAGLSQRAPPPTPTTSNDGLSFEDAFQGAYAYDHAASWGENVTAKRSGIEDSEWFSRGWTLQELLAPNEVIFCNVNWQEIGRKQEFDFCKKVAAASGIPIEFLAEPSLILNASIAQRMNWASARTTTREEDIGYCLLGLFGVNMPLLYGEGKKAFVRLQEEIIKQSDDESILAWTRRSEDSLTGFNKDNLHPILAAHAREFRDSENIYRIDKIAREPYSVTNKGLQFIADAVYLRWYDAYIVQLNCAEGFLATASDVEAFARHRSFENIAGGPATTPCLIALKETRKGLFARLHCGTIDLSDWEHHDFGVDITIHMKERHTFTGKRFLLEIRLADSGGARTQEYRLVAEGKVRYLRGREPSQMSQYLFGAKVKVERFEMLLAHDDSSELLNMTRSIEEEHGRTLTRTHLLAWHQRPITPTTGDVTSVRILHWTSPHIPFSYS